MLWIMKLLEIPPAPPIPTSGRHARTWRDYEWGALTPFLLVHVLGIAGAIAGIALGAPAWAWLLALGLYVARMFGITGGYHRYFSHRTFKTGRVVQFLLAFLAMSSAQRGVLWWAARSGQFDDMEGPAHAILMDDDKPKPWSFAIAIASSMSLKRMTLKSGPKVSVE